MRQERIETGATPAPLGRLPRIADDELEDLRRIVKDAAGIALRPTKRELVHARLGARLRCLGLGSYRQYLDRLVDGSGGELDACINALTTNVTAFFREVHHFEVLGDEALPRLLERHAGERRLRLWSAGCSSGEEPWSIAMTVLSGAPDLLGWDLKVLATDIDSNVLCRGTRGVYSAEEVSPVPDALRRRFFQLGVGGNRGSFRVRKELRERVFFRRHNLCGTWPMRGPFQAIFCRNVLIYMEPPEQKRVLDGLLRLLEPGGYLFLGPSESILEPVDAVSVRGPTAYRKL